MRGAIAIIHPTMPMPPPQAATGELWHIIRTQVQGERKAFRWLSYRFFHTYLPTERHIVRFGRFQKRPVWRPLLPGYVFAQLPIGFDPDEVRRLPGVDDFLKSCGHMATLSSAGIDVIREIEAKLAQPEKRGLSHSFREGDRVRLTDDAGSWAGVEARIQRLDKGEKVVLSLILPARVVPVTVSASWLTLIDG